MEKGVIAEQLSLCHGDSDGESISNETHSKPSDKVFSPVEKQLISVKGRPNFVPEQSGICSVSAELELLSIRAYIRNSVYFQYKLLSGKSHPPVKALSPSRKKVCFRENISWKCSCELMCLLFS